MTRKSCWGMVVLSGLLLLSPSWGRAMELENPQPGSFQSGSSVISGWVCDATTLTVTFDGVVSVFEAPYGSSRADTVAACGDTDNGFGLLFNFNLLGDGEHTVRVLVDGSEFASATFTVTTLGSEFLSGATGSGTAMNFPGVSQEVGLVWQESSQNFSIAALQTKEAVEIVENDAGTLTSKTVYTVPAGKRLVITDVAISNANANVVTSQRIARNGDFVTTLFVVGAESTLTHTFATGIEFAAGDEVRVRNGQLSGETHFYLRGYLVEA